MKKTLLKNTLRILGTLARMLAVWLLFLAVLWLSRGAGGGYPAFFAALCLAGLLWWRRTRPQGDGTRRTAAATALAMVAALAPLAWILVPLAPSTLAPLAADASSELWPTGPGRAVAVYRYPADPASARQRALVFAHGGPGGYVRDFDRAFFATFAKAGFDVVLYDQSGAGRSPLDNAAGYTHENNVNDLAAVLARVDMPTVLVGQSYGTTLVTSALARDAVRRRVTHVVLTEPGALPGASIALGREMSSKTTRAADATLTPDAGVLLKMMAPRALLAAAFLPRGNGLAPQEEIVNHYTPDVQRMLVSNAFCKGDTALLERFEPGRFNLLVNGAVRRDARAAVRPDLRAMSAPVMLLLGECSYIPRGRAMEYFDTYAIARSHAIPGVGHIVWGNPAGQALVRDAIVRFVDAAPGALPNQPTRDSAARFVAEGR